MKIDTYGFAPIVKYERDEHGNLLVTGRIADDATDRDEQICDPGWLDKAVPSWFSEGGNVREMHTLIASGVGIQHWKAEDGGHMLTAKIVDQGSISKVENDVLKGFSIGIKNGRVASDLIAKGGRIVDGQIIEVSLVDRPANPNCLLTIAKADDAGHAEVVEQVLVEDVKADEPERPETDAVPAETVSKAQKVLDALTELNLVKADDGEQPPATDVQTAQQAAALIARLIQSEAAGLAGGDWGERYDIQLLLDAVEALRWYCAAEQAQDNDDDGDVQVFQLADEPDVAKSDGPRMMPLDEEFHSLVRSIVDEAVTKAVETVKAEADAKVGVLTERLAKVEATPLPGGPVRTRTSDLALKAETSDRDRLLAQAQEYRTKADAATDPEVRDGYRTLAAQKAREAAQ